MDHFLHYHLLIFQFNPFYFFINYYYLSYLSHLFNLIIYHYYFYLIADFLNYFHFFIGTIHYIQLHPNFKFSPFNFNLQLKFNKFSCFLNNFPSFFHIHQFHSIHSSFFRIINNFTDNCYHYY